MTTPKKFPRKLALLLALGAITLTAYFLVLLRGP